MQDDSQIVNTVAPIANVALMTELVERTVNRAPGLPGMATFYGPSGYGKTFAAIYAANRYRAYHVQMKSTYTAKHLCQMVAREIGLDERGTVASLVDRIGEQLALSQRPLLIDEADFLVKKKMIEVVRDLYESSGAAVVLIGEEHFPRKVEQWERVHGRMLDWVAAQPVTRQDAQRLANVYCRGVEIEDSLFAKLLSQSGASARRISINLNAIREFARTRKMDTVTLKDWQKDFPTGRAPSARRVA